MRRYLPLLLSFAFLALSGSSIQAQCKGFAKKMCKPELAGYIHDGNYHVAILTEGEEAELYKTFYSGQNYRIAVCGSLSSLPPIEFQVVDAYKNIIYDNSTHNAENTWDFSLESSQQLKVVVKVPVSDPQPEFPNSGCVAIMFGIQEE